MRLQNRCDLIEIVCDGELELVVRGLLTSGDQELNHSGVLPALVSAIGYLTKCLRVFTKRTPRATLYPTSKLELGSDKFNPHTPRTGSGKPPCSKICIERLSTSEKYWMTTGWPNTRPPGPQCH